MKNFQIAVVLLALTALLFAITSIIVAVNTMK